MYRRPLQSVLRLGLRAGQTSEREAISRALLACRLAGASPPCATRCRTLHFSPQFYNVKETPQHSEEEKIKIAALRMYTCCVERINYDDFFERCTLPDTLNSWFLIAQLHVW
ncbi:hypothetical protein CRUP_006064 [Coryphaenoides rupestris]|nr:hypothetical protein CRUP_006064 [Coryphaenoides rupestris]